MKRGFGSFQRLTAAVCAAVSTDAPQHCLPPGSLFPLVASLGGGSFPDPQFCLSLCHLRFHILGLSS